MYSELTRLEPFDPTPLKDISLQGHCRVTADSRQIRPGDIFIAYRGEYADGRDYIQAAIEKGAAAIVYEADSDFRLPATLALPAVGIANLRESAGEVAAQLLQHPSQHMALIGITGTNGKTSVSQWLAQAFDLLGQKCAITGTVGNGFWGALQTGTHTTPDAVTVQSLLADFYRQGAQAVAMEVSSHGLDQYRVNGVAFDTAVFTNLTRDHLDYHGDMASYGESKRRLFAWRDLQNAVINIDDDFGRKLVDQLHRERPALRVITYGFSADADVCITHFQAALTGNTLQLTTPWGKGEIRTRLLGRFNAQNLAACIVVLGAHGFALTEILTVLTQIKPARGRMDCIFTAGKPLVVIDYAHTPDALEKALTTLQELKTPTSRLWCVFGCGGNRDAGKRPLMGAVAAAHADCVVVTSDNPRLENPQTIIDDILPAVPQPAHVNPDRAAAIAYAVSHANAEDIVLIAGKGHETYQDIGGVKQHFDDFEVAQQLLTEAASQ